MQIKRTFGESGIGFEGGTLGQLIYMVSSIARPSHPKIRLYRGNPAGIALPYTRVLYRLECGAICPGRPTGTHPSVEIAMPRCGSRSVKACIIRLPMTLGYE